MVLSVFASCLVLAPSAAAAGEHIADVPPGTGDCADITLVATDTAEPRVDVYIAKAEHFPNPPGDPSLADFVAFVDEVKERALEELFSDPTLGAQGRPDIQIEIVFAETDDGDDGYRATFLVDLNACVPH